MRATCCLILLGGCNGAGKDTLAKVFASCFQDAIITSIAAPLKQEFAQAYEFPLSWLSDRAFKDSVRPRLIAWADARRQQDADYWIRQVTIPKNKTVIFTDFRFMAEYEYLKNHYSKTHTLVPVLIKRVGYTENHTNVADPFYSHVLTNEDKDGPNNQQQAREILRAAGILYD